MTVLVTGAAGFAGSHLLDLLLRETTDVAAWHRPDCPPDPPFVRDGVRWMGVDLLDRRQVAEAIAGLRPSVIYHCGAAAHLGQSWNNTHQTLAVNALGTHHLIEAVRQAGLRPRILIPGSAAVYQPSDAPLAENDPLGPASPYALSKLAQEMLGRRAAEEGDLEVFLTRSFNHTGARQDPSYMAPGFARQIALIEAGQAPPVVQVGNLEARRDLTDVRDTVRAYRRLVEKGRAGIVYNVCSGRAYAAGEILERLLARARTEVEVRVDRSRYRPHDAPLVVGDGRRIREDTGWQPETSIDQTLDDLLDYWTRQVKSIGS